MKIFRQKGRFESPAEKTIKVEASGFFGRIFSRILPRQNIYKFFVDFFSGGAAWFKIKEFEAKKSIDIGERTPKKKQLNEYRDFKKFILDVISDKNYSGDSLVIIRSDGEDAYLEVVDSDSKFTKTEIEFSKEALFKKNIFFRHDFLRKQDFMHKYSHMIAQEITSNGYFKLSDVRGKTVKVLEKVGQINSSSANIQLLELLGLNRDDIDESLVDNRFFLEKLGSERFREDKFRRLLSGLLKKHENEILDEVGFTKDVDRHLLVQKLEQLKPESITNKYVYDKLLIQAKLWEEMGGIEKMKNIDFDQLYRFVIDGDKEEGGDYIFENEPGYILGCFRGLYFALKGRNDNKTIDWHERLHDQIVESVYEKEKIETIYKYVPLRAGLAPKGSHMGFSPDLQDQDQAGIDDLEKRCAVRSKGELKSDKLKGMPFYFVIKKNQRFICSNITCEGRKQRDKLNELFEQMNKMVENETNPIVRLMGIAWLARELELRHIYTDGNGRTSIKFIYSLVAADEDLPMIMFHDPNILDANGPEKLCARLLEAMEKFANGGKVDAKELSKEHISVSDISVSEKLSGFKTLAEEFFKDDKHKSWPHFHDMMSSEER